MEKLYGRSHKIPSLLTARDLPLNICLSLFTAIMRAGKAILSRDLLACRPHVYARKRDTNLLRQEREKCTRRKLHEKHLTALADGVKGGEVSSGSGEMNFEPLHPRTFLYHLFR